MDKKFIESMRKKLAAERAVITESLENEMNDIKAQVKKSGAGDAADVASDVTDRTMYDTMAAQDSERLELIDDALDRICQGQYGVCLKCGKEIPKTRLSALPFAVMCISCTEEEERNNR